VIRAAPSRELEEALSHLADVDKEIQKCDSDKQDSERGLDPLRQQLEKLSRMLDSQRSAEDATSSLAEVGSCRYRELLQELEEKMAIARSKRRLAQRERRTLEIRRSHILATIPPEILLAYRALVKASS
jgi:chromosome segregation ATPase